MLLTSFRCGFVPFSFVCVKSASGKCPTRTSLKRLKIGARYVVDFVDDWSRSVKNTSSSKVVTENDERAST
ncbi:hypothetical protein Plhal703r1_c03g0018041 [Plasmopara halstedii]